MKSREKSNFERRYLQLLDNAMKFRIDKEKNLYLDEKKLSYVEFYSMTKNSKVQKGYAELVIKILVKVDQQKVF